MSRALELAARGLWTTDPNPRVGCVLADGEQVIAEGWHERAGGPHAEAMALATAGDRARGSTAYVTLEPCCHQGRTPPCADALIEAGIQRVCYAVRDPNPRVAGGGIARLAAAGVALAGGLLEAEARRLNPGFLSRFERGRPWVRVLPATMAESEAGLQSLRARASAILTGAGRIRDADPRLDVQLQGVLRQPLRVVLDTTLSIAPGSRSVAPPGQLLVLSASADPDRRKALEAAGARVERLPAGPGGLDLAAVLQRLCELEVNELQVEAGTRLTASLHAAGFVDEVAGVGVLDNTPAAARH
jgi:diaminohydroxyphosphoribosylaminopyrimidine deaminase/5-amino-6-(5-phosphoribosylamino)uracil reductase